MKKTSYIARALGFLMFTVVMLTSVLGKQFPQVNEKIAETKHEKADKKQQPENRTVVSELSLEVVVPSHAFDFGHSAIILPTPQQVVFLIVEKTFQKISTKPVFLIAYFENLYEHFIAPNAP